MFLSYNDDATIRNILETRLESLPGVKILDWKVKKMASCTKIGVLLDVDDLKLTVESVFELPHVFDKRQLLNEIDEIAEGVKQARIDTACVRIQPKPFSKLLPGTGIRGNFYPRREHL